MAKYQIVSEGKDEKRVLFENTRKREIEKEFNAFIKLLKNGDCEYGKYSLQRVNIGHYKGTYYSYTACTSIDVEYYIRKEA